MLINIIIIKFHSAFKRIFNTGNCYGVSELIQLHPQVLLLTNIDIRLPPMRP